MIGRNLWRLRRPPRRGVYRHFGIPDLDTRQKWAAVWPVLRAADRPGGLRLLDAGCGPGTWSLELAARQPHWTVVGIDIDAPGIDQARRDATVLALPNVSFAVADFLVHEPAAPVDIVLSVFSAHHVIDDGLGPELFARFGSWLRPGGSLVCLLPRPLSEVPMVAGLARLDWRGGLPKDEVAAMVTEAGLTLRHLSGRTGRPGTLAKQLTRTFGSGRRRALWPIVYPVAWVLSVLDRPRAPVRGRSSAFWLVVAEANGAP